MWTKASFADRVRVHKALLLFARALVGVTAVQVFKAMLPRHTICAKYLGLSAQAIELLGFPDQTARSWRFQ